MTGRFFLGAIAAAFLCLGVAQPSAFAGEETLIETIRQIKPSIVGIGVRSPLDRPVNQLIGTGFVVADGRHAITNLHVVNERVTPGEGRTLAVFVGTGENVEARPARIVAKDEAHDVAILAFEGKKLPAMRLGGDKIVDEGMNVAFTGFPIGAVYGLHPVTHRGMVSAVTPIAIPQISSRTLNTDMIRRLQDRFNVFQLDATAYPGNSGSPVYDPETGEVVAIISSVFVKESRENVLSKPSGITFAIPIQYALRLLHSQDIESP
jgi:S1-C subfamily serine protease